MNSTDLLVALRDELADQAEPYLWSDPALYRYLNEAQNMFCRLTEGIEDSTTPETCRAALAVGEQWVTVSPKVLKLREVVNITTGRALDVVNTEKATWQGVVFDGRAGPVRVLVTGLEKHRLRAWPVANEATPLELRVFRLPLASISSPGMPLEVDEQHHNALLLWAKSLAYGKEDAETFDRRRAGEYDQRFRAYCAAARVEQERARRSTGTVCYGGL